MEKRNEYAEPTQKKNTKYAIMEQREYAVMKTYGLRLCEQSCMNIEQFWQCVCSGNLYLQFVKPDAVMTDQDS